MGARDKVWPRIGQLLLEVHMWNRGASVGGLHRWAAALNAIPMKVFHAAKNTNSQDSVYIGLTSVHELAFVNPSRGSPPRKLTELSFSEVNDGRLLSDIIEEVYQSGP